MKHLVWLLTVCLLVPIGLQAQDESTPVIKTDVNLVQVPATVRDKKGHLIGNLTAADFILEEDGRPQVIDHFSRSTDLPLTVGLLVDTSLSQRRIIEEERMASSEFFNQVLHPDRDRAFIISFDIDSELLKDLTASRDQLEGALRHLQTPEPDPDARRRGVGTVLYDAVYLGASEILAPQSGHKAMVVISDGVDMGSMTSLADAIRAAQNADTVVYTILYADKEGYRRWGGLGGGGRLPGGIHIPGTGGSRQGRRGPGRPGQRPRTDGKQILQELSSATGGTFFQVSGKETLQKIYHQIQDELRTQYIIAYKPDHPASGGNYHTISLRTRQPDTVVHCRSGYYSAKGPHSD